KPPDHPIPATDIGTAVAEVCVWASSAAIGRPRQANSVSLGTCAPPPLQCWLLQCWLLQCWLLQCWLLPCWLVEDGPTPTPCRPARGACAARILRHCPQPAALLLVLRLLFHTK